MQVPFVEGDAMNRRVAKDMRRVLGETCEMIEGCHIGPMVAKAFSGDMILN